MRLQVCAITAAFPAPSEPTRAVFLRNFLAAMAAAEEAGVEVTVVAPRIDRRDPPREEVDGLAVERFAYPSGGRRLKEHADVPWAALAAYVASGLTRSLAVIRERSPRLIYAHWALPAGVIAAAAAAVTDLPLAVHVHGSDLHRYAVRGPGRLAARWVLGRADLVLAVSGELARRAIDLGAPADRVRVVPMGVDGRFFRPRAPEGTPEEGILGRNGRLEALFVGDLDPWKGIGPLAEAVRSSKRLGDAVRLHVVGDGVLRGELEAGRRGREDAVVLHGRLSQEKVASLCRSADVLVLPSRGEGAPLAVLEALASGLPVLATPVGGVPELLEDGAAGWLAAAEEFPERLLRLAADRDEVERARRAAAAAAAADRSAERRAREALAALREAAP